jgi:hypothetical protein
MHNGRKFQITYTMTPRDYTAMTRAVTRRPWQRRLITLALWLFSVWCLLVLFTDVFNPITMIRAIIAAKSWAWILAIMTGVLLYTVASHWIAWAISFAYYRELASADATITMTLTDEGVGGESNVTDTKAPWTTVKRIIREKDYLFLPISKREAFILPRRGFASNTQFDAAHRFATERVSAPRYIG